MTPHAPVEWNRRTAAHLLVRAGFGATPEQIAAAADRPLEEVVDGLLKPAAHVEPPDWVTPSAALKPDFKELMQGLTDEEQRALRQLLQQEQGAQQRELAAWWIRRMVASPCPLQEKMALFWHGHFATSIRKVNIAYMMYAQNQTFRDHALGNFRELVTAVAQDPAMLVYLDNTMSRSSSPNENFARELMELFTLGEGHYTEQDIKEAARAFTGWMVDPRRFAFLDATQTIPGTKTRNRPHDDGTKVFFGQEGNFDGHDVIRIILEQEQAARFMVAKLWRFFAYGNPEPELVEELAAVFRMNGYAIAPVLKAMFTHPAFYGDKAVRTQIKSPVQWLVGSCIALGVANPDMAYGLNALRTLGQELFAPPNVKGWDGGYAWITTSSLTQRYNLAAQLVNHRPKPEKGRKEKPPYTVDTATVLPEKHRETTALARGYLEERIYQARLGGEGRARLDTFFATQPQAKDWTDAQVRNILHAMMGTPEYQLT